MPLEALPWLLFLFVLIIVLFFAVTFLRRHFRSDEGSADEEVFSLGSLRTMLKQGQITQEEYDRLREQVISAVKKPAPGPPGPTPPKPPLPE